MTVQVHAIAQLAGAWSPLSVARGSGWRARTGIDQAVWRVPLSMELLSQGGERGELDASPPGDLTPSRTVLRTRVKVVLKDRIGRLLVITLRLWAASLWLSQLRPSSWSVHVLPPLRVGSAAPGSPQGGRGLTRPCTALPLASWGARVPWQLLTVFSEAGVASLLLGAGLACLLIAGCLGRLGHHRRFRVSRERGPSVHAWYPPHCLQRCSS